MCAPRFLPFAAADVHANNTGRCPEPRSATFSRGRQLPEPSRAPARPRRLLFPTPPLSFFPFFPFFLNFFFKKILCMYFCPTNTGSIFFLPLFFAVPAFIPPPLFPSTFLLLFFFLPFFLPSPPPLSLFPLIFKGAKNPVGPGSGWHGSFLPRLVGGSGRVCGARRRLSGGG